MKRSFLIILLFLACFFCLKDILLFTSSVRDSVCYSIDIEEESSEESEKGDIDEKDDLEKWHPNSSHKLSEINSLTNGKFRLDILTPSKFVTTLFGCIEWDTFVIKYKPLNNGIYLK